VCRQLSAAASRPRCFARRLTPGGRNRRAISQLLSTHGHQLERQRLHSREQGEQRCLIELTVEIGATVGAHDFHPAKRIPRQTAEVPGD
jgi:hypothetical protein